MKTVQVTPAIFREPSAVIPYRININEPTMAALYRQFKEVKKLPHHYPISTAERLAFENGVFAMIERGIIVVKGQGGKS